MTQSKHTKKALLASALSVVVCLAMLIGSTFAWFTDSVTSGKNTIVAGNLDVELTHTNGAVTEETVAGATDLFVDKDGKTIQWEPGVVAYENFKVENVGSLALKYQLSLKINGYNTVADSGKSLLDVLKVAIVPDVFEASRENVADLDFEPLSTVSKPGNLAANGDSNTFGVVIYWEPSDLDNDYNLNNGKMSSDGAPLYIDLGVKLTATQDTVENDSFDNLYDEDAFYYDRSVSTAEELVAALDNPEVTNIAVSADITFNVSNGGKMQNKVINGITGDETITFNGYGSVNPIKGVTLKNIKVADETSKDNPASWEWMYLKFEDLTAMNVEFVDSPMLDGTCALTDCKFAGSTDEYGAWIDSGDITLKNCTFNGMRMLKIHEAYGSDVASVVIDGCTFNGLFLKAGIDFGTLNTDTSVTVRNSTFNNCKGGIYEGDTPVTNFIYVEENNTIN